MSEPEAHEIEAVIAATETRLYEKLGRWGLAHAVGGVLLVVSIAAGWFGLQSRVEALETWKQDRAKPIEQYYGDQATLSLWRGSVDSKLDNLSEDIAEIKFGLGIRSEAELNELRRKAEAKEQAR